MTGVVSAQSGAVGQRGYDRVGVPGPDGALSYFTKAQFEKLPLIERVQHLAKGQLRFYRQDVEVPPGEALKAL